MEPSFCVNIGNVDRLGRLIEVFGDDGQNLRRRWSIRSFLIRASECGMVITRDSSVSMQEPSDGGSSIVRSLCRSKGHSDLPGCFITDPPNKFDVSALDWRRPRQSRVKPRAGAARLDRRPVLQRRRALLMAPVEIRSRGYPAWASFAMIKYPFGRGQKHRVREVVKCSIPSIMRA